jgi:type II secretory pathway pseudopilin PulG
MQYHVAQNGEKIGPLEKEEVLRRLIAGELKPNDLGWHEGLAEWEPLSKLIPPPQPPPLATGSGVFATPGGQPQMAVAPQGTSGLAIASLICGILVFLTVGLTGLPAVILGHLGLSKIKKSGGTLKGGGMAIAGLIMGYLGFGLTLIAVLASLAVPAFNMVQQQGNQMKAVNNAKQIVMGMKQYAADHDGKYPPTIETLFEEQILTDRKLLEFPGTVNVPGQGWDYRGAEFGDTDPGNVIVLMTKQADRSKKKIVARNDGSVAVERASAVP